MIEAERVGIKFHHTIFRQTKVLKESILIFNIRISGYRIFLFVAYNSRYILERIQRTCIVTKMILFVLLVIHEQAVNRSHFVNKDRIPIARNQSVLDSFPFLSGRNSNRFVQNKSNFFIAVRCRFNTQPFCSNNGFLLKNFRIVITTDVLRNLNNPLECFVFKLSQELVHEFRVIQTSIPIKVISQFKADRLQKCYRLWSWRLEFNFNNI